MYLLIAVALCIITSGIFVSDRFKKASVELSAERKINDNKKIWKYFFRNDIVDEVDRLFESHDPTVKIEVERAIKTCVHELEGKDVDYISKYSKNFVEIIMCANRGAIPKKYWLYAEIKKCATGMDYFPPETKFYSVDTNKYREQVIIYVVYTLRKQGIPIMAKKSKASTIRDIYEWYYKE